MDKRCQGVYHTQNANTTRVTTYCYASKHILKSLKNPKHLKFIAHDGYDKISDKISKSVEFGEKPLNYVIYIK